MLKRFEEHFTEAEKKAIQSSTKEIRTFFTYIQQ
jgi:hypothetical protein